MSYRYLHVDDPGGQRLAYAISITFIIIMIASPAHIHAPFMSHDCVHTSYCISISYHGNTKLGANDHSRIEYS